jgi:hypothetical protein
MAPAIRPTVDPELAELFERTRPTDAEHQRVLEQRAEDQRYAAALAARELAALVRKAERGIFGKEVQRQTAEILAEGRTSVQFSTVRKLVMTRRAYERERARARAEAQRSAQSLLRRAG